MNCRATLLLAALTVAGTQLACEAPAVVLTQLADARRLASQLRVEFTRAAEASNRAVMADTDEASRAAADEGRGVRQTVEEHVAALQSRLRSLGYTEDLRRLDAFTARFEEYRSLDDEILALAVENTNLKAQRLSFGPGQDAADAFRRSLDETVKHATMTSVDRLKERAAAGHIAILEVQALQAPHIAAAQDDAMARMEAQMDASIATARRAVTDLGAPPAAMAALDRFTSINSEIVKLSRQNTNVRSLTLSLGRKRTVTAQCDDLLRALEEAMAKHEFTATR